MNKFMTMTFMGARVQAPPGFKYTWHMLWHGAASNMATLEVSERWIKDFGDWSHRSDAYETYVHTVQIFDFCRHSTTGGPPWRTAIHMGYYTGNVWL